MAISNDETIDYEELYIKYSAQILEASKKYCNHDRQLAQDAMQTAFETLFIKLEAKKPVDDYCNYLFATAKYYIFNYKKHEKHLSYDEDIVAYCDARYQEKSSETTYFEREDTKEMTDLTQAILELVEKKNSTWSYIIREVFQNERSQIEVAEEMGMTTQALYSSIRRIRVWAQKNEDIRRVLDMAEFDEGFDEEK